MGTLMPQDRVEHKLLQEDKARTLHEAATDLAEMAQAFEHRRHDIERQIEATLLSRAPVVNQFRRESRSREATQRMLTDLDVKHRVSIQRLERVNANEISIEETAVVTPFHYAMFLVASPALPVADGSAGSPNG